MKIGTGIAVLGTPDSPISLTAGQLLTFAHNSGKKVIGCIVFVDGQVSSSFLTTVNNTSEFKIQNNSAGTLSFIAHIIFEYASIQSTPVASTDSSLTKL